MPDRRRNGPDGPVTISEEPAPGGLSDRGGARRHTQLAEDVREVAVHGVIAENSRSAMFWLLRPSATSRSTSISRLVRPGGLLDRSRLRRRCPAMDASTPRARPTSSSALQLGEHVNRAMRFVGGVARASERGQRPRQLRSARAGLERRAALQIEIDGVFEMLSRRVGVAASERDAAGCKADRCA